MPKDSTPPDPDLHRLPFWALFEKSRIPMALVDRDRRYVAVNEPAVELFQYPRAEVLGNIAGRTVIDDPATADADWERLLRTDELYGERVVAHANGTQVRVSFAAHATTVDDRWLALFVTLSARLQPGGPELIGASTPEAVGVTGSKLTRREREVVRLVALGADTRRIAAELALSSETVRTHVRNAMSKTGAHTRAQLVALVLADRLLEDQTRLTCAREETSCTPC